MAESLTDDQQHRRRQAVAELMQTRPCMGWLGIVFERYEPDDVTVRLPFREDLTNDGEYFHGGVVAAVLDTTGAAAARSNHDFEKGSRAATVSMTVQYVGAPASSPVYCSWSVPHSPHSSTRTSASSSPTAGGGKSWI